MGVHLDEVYHGQCCSAERLGALLLSWLAKGCFSGARFIQILILDDSMSIEHANQVEPPQFQGKCHRMSSDVIGMKSPRLESPRIGEH
jgi:hypothetical protein